MSALVGAFSLAIGCGSLIALVPIRNLLRGELAEGALTDRSGAGDARANRTQQTLIVAEVLLAVVLATGASLLIRTVDQLRSIDPGFEATGVLAAGVMVSEADASPEERAIFFDRLRERASALPGVSHAGYMNRLPLRDGGYQGPVAITDRPDLAGAARPTAMYRPVGPEVIDALGMEIVRGRGILSTDGPDTPPVAVVNETFARAAWGDADPIGRTFTSGFVGEVRVVGASLGGLLALDAAHSLSRRVHTLVLAATPGRRLDGILRGQLGRDAPALVPAVDRVVDTIISTGRVRDDLPRALAVLFPRHAGPFLQRLFTFEPAPVLSALPIGCLVVQGGADRQIVPMEDVQPLIDALRTRVTSMPATL